jgi:hypothetical protein
MRDYSKISSENWIEKSMLLKNHEKYSIIHLSCENIYLKNCEHICYLIDLYPKNALLQDKDGVYPLELLLENRNLKEDYSKYKLSATKDIIDDFFNCCLKHNVNVENYPISKATCEYVSRYLHGNYILFYL